MLGASEEAESCVITQEIMFILLQKGRGSTANILANLKKSEIEMDLWLGWGQPAIMSG